MEQITALFDKLNNLEELPMPELDKLLDSLVPVMQWAVLAGPILVLFFGLLYLLVPPKEANHSLGFRTYFGMGSVKAWLFTQKLAGIVLGALGLILTAVMYFTTRSFGAMEANAMMQKASQCLLWELGLVLLAYVGITVTVAVLFDRKGRRRGTPKEEIQTA